MSTPKSHVYDFYDLFDTFMFVSVLNVFYDIYVCCITEHDLYAALGMSVIEDLLF